jgi:hypothetical protein
MITGCYSALLVRLVGSRPCGLCAEPCHQPLVTSRKKFAEIFFQRLAGNRRRYRVRGICEYPTNLRCVEHTTIYENFATFFWKKKNSAKISANSNMDDSSKGGSDLLPSYTSFLYFLVFQVLSCTSWSLYYFYLWYLAKKANNRDCLEKHPRRSVKNIRDRIN